MDPNTRAIKTSIGSSQKFSQPFYEPPLYCQKTSVDIINEARVAIKGKILCLKNSQTFCSFHFLIIFIIAFDVFF